MSRTDREPLVRLSAINRGLSVVSHGLGELLLSMAEWQNGGDLTAGTLRAVGHELVTLAGDLTKLGVDMARWADELDQPADFSPPSTDNAP